MFVRVKVCVNMGCDRTHQNSFIFSLWGNCKGQVTKRMRTSDTQQPVHFLPVSAAAFTLGWTPWLLRIDHLCHTCKLEGERWWILVPFFFYAVECSHCVLTSVDLTQYSNELSLVRGVPLSTAVNFLQGRHHCCWNSRAGVMVTFTNTTMNSDRRYCHPGISCIPN